MNGMASLWQHSLLLRRRIPLWGQLFPQETLGNTWGHLCSSHWGCSWHRWGGGRGGCFPPTVPRTAHQRTAQPRIPAPSPTSHDNLNASRERKRPWSSRTAWCTVCVHACACAYVHFQAAVRLRWERRHVSRAFRHPVWVEYLEIGRVCKLRPKA